jgi:hypothetical protein
MDYETIVGPLSRVICCLVPCGWLPVLLIAFVFRRGWRDQKPSEEQNR